MVRNIQRLIDWDNSGVTFTITSAGKLQYTSTNLAGANYSGIMKWNYIKMDV